MKATIGDLRYRMKEVLNAVERGETVTVTYRGKPKARIVPISEKQEMHDITKHPAFGMWKDREDMKNPSAWVRKLRLGRRFDI